ncbi:MAG TPA: hypothetical protein VE154_07410, partial [Chthoniobacterales bacterium]|nr:hypothetical protein [Chthoniobacterales bacterium]
QSSLDVRARIARERVPTVVCTLLPDGFLGLRFVPRLRDPGFHPVAPSALKALSINPVIYQSRRALHKLSYRLGG